MTNKEIIYEAFLKANKDAGGVTLTTKELNELGFNSPTITKLINEKIIKREKRGIYILDSLDSVIDYGNKLLKFKEKGKANMLFDICYQTDPTNKNVALQKMNSLVCRSSYKETYNLFNSLCQQEILSEIDKIIFNHLFYYTWIDKYKSENDFLDLEKERYFLKKSKRKDNIDNQIINCILSNDFSTAQTLISFYKENITIQDKFIINLIRKINFQKGKNMTIVKKLIDEKRYIEARRVIDNNSKLTLKDKRAFNSILNDKMSIESGKTIAPTSKNANGFYQAIETKNYNLAQDLIKTDKKLSMYKELIDDILKDCKKNKNIEFFSIIEALTQQNIEEAISLLDQYLKEKQKENFKNLAFDYIKVSILEQDMAYTKPMILLTQIDNTVSFNLSSTLQDFYKALSVNNAVLSKAYLNIISSANALGLCDMNIDHLYVALENIKGIEINQNLIQLIERINKLKNKDGREKVLEKEEASKKYIPTFNEELALIYDLVISDQKLTEKTITNLGISKEQIENFMEKNILKRVRRYEYTIVSTDQLYDYRKYLQAICQYDKAEECVIKSFEIDPENERNIKYAFSTNVRRDELKIAYEIFHKIKEKELAPRQTLNCWLYLLNFILPLTPEDKQVLNYLTKEDFYFLDNKEEIPDVSFENNIIKLILEKRAYFETTQLLKQNKSIYDHSVTRKLLHCVLQKNKNRLYSLVELVDKKEYETIVDQLKNTNIENSIFEKRVLKVVEDLLSLKNNEKMSSRNLSGTTTFDIAIEQKDYSTALTILNKSKSIRGISTNSKKDYILENILTDIICLTEKEKEGINDKENINSLDTVIALLNNQEVSVALEKINSYLRMMNKNEYHFLIFDLLKLDILENDFTFKRTVTELSNMQDSSYTFSIENLLPEFYDAIGNQKRIEAGIYLDIIKNCEEYKNEEEFIEQLENIVEGMQEGSNVEYKIHSNFLKVFDGLELSNQFVTNQKPIKVSNTKTEDNRIRRFLIGESKKLEQNDGIILLDQKYTRDKEQIEEIIKDMTGVGILTYGKDDNERIILRQTRACENDLEWKELKDQAKAAYINKSYEKSLEINKDLLQIMPEAKPYIIFSTALSYLKFRKLDKAIRLIKIADAITYAEDKEYHYTELLDSLMARSLREPGVKKANIKEFDFSENTYGLKNVEEIASLLVQTKYNVEDACQKLNLNEEDTNIVRLLCAKDSFIDNMEDIGNKYLKDVERSKNKTPKVKKIYGDIIKNKRVYLRSNSHKKTLLKEM